MDRAKKILSRMTVRQKLAQLTQLGNSVFTQDAAADTGPLHELQITPEDVSACGSVLGIIGAERIMEIQKKHLENDPNHIPLLFMQDVIHGFRTIFPINLALGCTWEPEAVERATQMAAAEAAVSGLHVSFSPMADLARDARWGRVMETTGEDPYLNALFSEAIVRGFQGDDCSDPQRLAACVKHIAGYGAAEAGRDYNTTEIGLNTLFEFYMPAYRAAVDSGAAMVMASFNALNGIPSAANRWLLDEVLRQKWGFDGVVISDWGAVQELIPHGVAADGAEAARKALDAGTDIEMATANYLRYGEDLIEAGKISEEQLDRAVLRVLRLKERLGLFENPYHGASPEGERKLLNCREHRAAAYELAVKSAVLLKNDGGLLPLSHGIKVAVIGPYGESREILGGWSCTGNPEEAVSLRQAFAQNDRGCSFAYAEGAGFGDDCDEALLQEACGIAGTADVIIMALGEHQDMSGEAASRANPVLPPAQMRLLKEIRKYGKPTVTVLFNGRPLIAGEICENTDALLEAWFPGSEGGNALADLLFGDRLPEGRLTMSFPYCVGQLPIYYNHFSTGRPASPENSGQRYLSHYIDAPNEPLFPFGYGLGYSATEYGDMQATAGSDSIGASVSVSNVGRYPITETVQLYLRDLYAQVVRPVRQLKGFQKITLAPGETRTVRFTLSKRELSYYAADGDMHFEPGEFTVSIGRNAADVLEKTVTAGEMP